MGCSWKEIATLIAIMLFALGLRLYCSSGFVGLDDAEYARFARQMAVGAFTLEGYDGPAVFPLRQGLIFPTSIAFRIFGISEGSLILYPLFLSILSVSLAYVCAKALFGPRAGLIAAALWSILPIEINNATKLLPDLPAAFYASAAVVSLLLLLGAHVQSRFPLLGGGMLAGSLFGLSWLSKESLAYFLPFCAAWMVITLKKNWTRAAMIWGGVAIGSLIILASEMIAYHHLTDDWLFRAHEIERNYRQWENGFFAEGSRFGWGEGESYLKALAKRLFVSGPSMVFLNDQFLFLTLLGMISSFHALYWKDRSVLIPALWFFTLFVMFNFSSSSFSSYMPLSLFHRYLYPIALPAVVLTSGFIAKLFSRDQNQPTGARAERFFWGTILVIFLLWIGGYNTFQNIKGANAQKGWAEDAQAVSHLARPSDRLYADALSIKALEFYWRYPEKMNAVDFEGMSSAGDIAPGSYLLFNSNAINWLEKNAGMWLSKSPQYRRPDFHSNLPAAFKKIWQNDHAALYRIE